MDEYCTLCWKIQKVNHGSSGSFYGNDDLVNYLDGVVYGPTSQILNGKMSHLCQTHHLIKAKNRQSKLN